MSLPPWTSRLAEACSFHDNVMEVRGVENTRRKGLGARLAQYHLCLILVATANHIITWLKAESEGREPGSTSLVGRIAESHGKGCGYGEGEVRGQ